MTKQTKSTIAVVATLAVFTAAFFAFCPLADSPKEQVGQYFGYVPHPDETEKFVASLPTPTIKDADPKLFQAGNVDTFLYRALHKAYKEKYGKDWVPHNQGIGDCVSHGFAHAADVSLAVDYEIGKVADFKSAATESIYGGSRVEARGVSRGGYSDGSYGGAAAKWLSQWGVIFRERYDDHDLTIYSSSKAKAWGNFGNGGADDNGKLDEIAKKHPARNVTLVRSFEEAAAAIQNGYAIAVCSGQGFSSTRDKDGFARPQGSWAHCLLPGTMVSTAVPKECQDVVIGDLIVTHKGRLRPVSQVMTKHYSGDVTRLRLGGCTDVTATRGHPILIYRPLNHEHWTIPGVDQLTYSGGKYAGARTVARKNEHEQRQPQWMDIADVRPRDYVLVPDKIDFTDVPTPQWKENRRCKNVPLPLWPDEDLAFLFGNYIADGSAVASHRICITTSSTDTHLPRLQKAVTKLGLTSRITDHGTFCRFYVDSSILANAFMEWFGTDSKTKRVPAFLMNGQWDLRALLEGYTAGDGTEIRGNRQRVTTVSETLGYQMWLIAIHLRTWPIMYAKPGGNPASYANSSDSLVIEYSNGEPQRKTARYWNGYYCIPVRDVEFFEYEGAVYNFDVEEDDSYLASGVVHHNCMAFSGVRFGNRPGLLCQNSWAKFNDGPKWPEDQPDGSFWVDATIATKMLKGGDSFAVAGVEGFKHRDIDHSKWVQLKPQTKEADSEALYAIAP